MITQDPGPQRFRGADRMEASRVASASSFYGKSPEISLFVLVGGRLVAQVLVSVRTADGEGNRARNCPCVNFSSERDRHQVAAQHTRDPCRAANAMQRRSLGARGGSGRPLGFHLVFFSPVSLGGSGTVWALSPVVGVGLAAYITRSS